MNVDCLVSICSTTYNREKYIAQAIESWISQKTNFEYEIIISDDCSIDGTIDIIECYIKNFPDKNITLLRSDKNQGYNLNAVKAYQAAKGKYIAQCDGDDYWIDVYKLQKQIDFLESHPDFIMCFTNTLIVNDTTGDSKVAKLNIWDQCSTNEIISQHNSIEAQKIGEINTLGHMSSLVFRNNVLTEFPDWYATTYNNDDTLFVMLSKYGKAKFLNENCTVYRVNSVGVSTSNFSFEKDIKGRIKYYNQLKSFLDYNFDKQINHLIALYFFKLTKLYYNNNHFLKALKSVFLVSYFDFKVVFTKLTNKFFMK